MPRGQLTIQTGLPAQYGQPFVPGRPQSPPIDTAGERSRSPLIDAFPVMATITAGFNVIPIQAAFTAAAGQSAWFPLIDFDPYAVLGQQVALVGFETELMSTNNNDQGVLPVTLYGIAQANQAAWGDHFGNKAAIVVGQNLPITSEDQAAAWTAANCPLPTLNDTITSDAIRFFDARAFPPGSCRDAIPFKDPRYKPYWPGVFRIGQGERLQAALVIDGAQAQAGASLNVVGFGLVKLSLGLTNNPQSFAP